MRSTISIILFVVSVLPLPSFAQEAPQIKFRGAYLGQPLSDYVDCSSGKAKAIEGWKSHGKVCDGKLGVVYHTKSSGLFDPKLRGEILHVEGRRVVKILIEVPNNDWEKVRYDLTQKLGEPLSEVPQEYGNLLGAKWHFNQGFWRNGDVVAYAGDQVQTHGPCGGFWATLAAANEPRQPCSESIEITITTAQRAGTPDTKPNSLD